MDPVTVDVSLEAWAPWLEIALKHAIDADQAHDQLKAALSADAQTEAHKSLDAEFRLAMQAITACAFALDALYSSLESQLPIPAPVMAQWTANRTPRPARICWVIHRAARMTNAEMKTVRTGVGSTFKYRNWAVHPPHEFRQAVIHPDLGSGVDWRFVAFRASNSHNIVTATFGALLRTFDNPRPQPPGLTEWAAGQKVILQTILTEAGITVTKDGVAEAL